MPIHPTDWEMCAEPETLATAPTKAMEVTEGGHKEPPYTILRSLPNYKIGDKLHPADDILCYSKEATAWAMNRLEVGDCVFVLRTDGNYTYSIFKGQSKEKSTVSFLVDYYGHFKVLPLKQFCNRIKVPVRSPWQARRANVVRQQQGRVVVGDIDKPIRRARRTTVSCDRAPNRSQELKLMLKWRKTLEDLSPRSTMILSSTPSDRALVVKRDQHDQLDEQDLMMRLVAPTNRVDKTLDCIYRDEMLTTLDDPSLDALPDQSEIDNFIDSGDSFRKNQERCPLLTSRGLESLPFTGLTLGTSAGAKSC